MPQQAAVGSLEDLGNLVKQKYPAYQSMDSAELGRRVQQKYPDAYSQYVDSGGAGSLSLDPQQQPQPPQQSQPQPAAPAQTPPPAPQPPAMNAPGPGAGSQSGSGFGTPTAQLPAPPIVDQGLFMPSEARRRANAAYDAQIEAQKAAEIAQGQRKAQAGQLEDVEAFKRRQRVQTLADLKAQGVEITPRMTAEILSGQNIQPELKPQMIPGYVKGSAILAGNPNALDAFGQPISPGEYHKIRKSADGTSEYFPEVGGTTKRLITRPDGKSYLETFDRSGAKMGEEPVINPQLLPQVTSNNGVTMQQMQVEDPDTHRLMVIQVPTPHETSTTTQRVVPGAPPVSLTPPPTGAAGAAGAAGAGPRPVTPVTPTTTVSPSGSALPKGARVIGSAPSQQRMDVQQPLSASAQAIVLKTQPQINTLTRLEKQLEPFKNSTEPLTLFLPRLAYNMGFSQDAEGVNKLLSSLEMSGITSAASALAGATRAGKFIEQAQLHTPRPWKDSGKLMYDKVSQIRQRLQDIVDVAKGPEGQRYPGLTQPPSGLTAPPQQGKKPLSEIFR